MHSATQVEVEAGWKRHTWPHRRYPQQCYARTTKYLLQHLEIDGARLVQSMIAHAPYFVPMAHAWVDLPGDVVFDGVVQAFFTRASYYADMVALALDTYSGLEAGRLEAAFRLRQDQDLEIVALLGIIQASHQVSRKYHLRIVRDPKWPLKNTERRAKQRAGYFSPPGSCAACSTRSAPPSSRPSRPASRRCLCV